MEGATDGNLIQGGKQAVCKVHKMKGRVERAKPSRFESQQKVFKSSKHITLLLRFDTRKRLL
jgi:hypothetical protein